VLVYHVFLNIWDMSEVSSEVVRPDGRPSVLTVNRVGFLGGVERVIVSAAGGLSARGLRPVLACPAGGELAAAARGAGVEVVGIGIDRTRATLSPGALRDHWQAWRRGRAEILRLAQTLRPEVIHVHHPVGGLYAGQACATLGIPLLLHVHEVLPARPLYALAARLVLRRCAAVVCVSGASAALMRRLGVPPARLRVIHNGVDPAFLRPVAPAEALRRRGPHVGLFGVLEPRKGQDHFIAAAARLARSHPEAQFWIVGGQSFAEHAGYAARLRAMAAAAGLADRVHFTGHRSDVAAWMAGMDVVVLASVAAESLPTVLIEAAALGRALVATDVGSVREIVTDGVTGCVVPPADAPALATAIARMLSPEGYGCAVRAAAEARLRFSPERFTNELTQLYQALARRHLPMEKAA
jgi:glycosyltransferase involved in cell wall biosynthesis